MFDTHCHLNFEAFDTSFEEVISRSKAGGVNFMLIPGTDLETSKKALEIAELHKNIFAAAGIHPTKDLDTLDLEPVIYKLTELAENEKVRAIGEIGLDYYRFRSPASKQIIFFEAQIKLAKKLGKSIIIHNRHAIPDVLKTVKASWTKSMRKRTVFHCCEADGEMLRFAVDHDIFIGVDGDVTYDKEKAEFVKKIPQELLVVETDSPYIIPEPLRTNKVFPNEPKNVILTLQYIAKLKNMKPNDLIEITTNNAKILFGLS